jgi:hypothetical protein
MNAPNEWQIDSPTRKVLWIAEAVTLAHVVRPLAVQPNRGFRLSLAIGSSPESRDRERVPVALTIAKARG